MKIELSNAGKRFNREWIFRKASLSFHSAEAVAITGSNGSGKSTLLQCLGGMMELSEGSIHYYKNDQPVGPEQRFREVSFCAPYLSVIEEMSFSEFLAFHQQFKSFLPGIEKKQIMDRMGLAGSADKQIRLYSSGMKQRVRLAQAIFSDTDLLLLDEPCSNLDAKGIDLYHELIAAFAKDRLVIVCSNDPVEYSFCSRIVSISDYK